MTSERTKRSRIIKTFPGILSVSSVKRKWKMKKPKEIVADDDSQFSEKYEELKKEHETLKQKLFEKEDELFNLNR